ncbi:MAG: hypothetical protein WCF90_08945 [Methanomicrobiales archaeon]
MIGYNAGSGTSFSANVNMAVAKYRYFLLWWFKEDANVVFANYPANSTAEVVIYLAQIMTD